MFEPVPSEPDAALAARRTAQIAGATLAAVMAAHVLLETARDALFLEHVSVERLPFVTIAVAFLALLAARGPADRSHRRMLFTLQLAAAVGTLGFFLLLGVEQGWTYYVLYVWSGVITAVIVVRFWLWLGDLFTITEGKRRFATVALGGSAGALIGALIAALLAPRAGGPALLLASAGFYALSALGTSAGLPRPQAIGVVRDREAGRHSAETEPAGLADSFSKLFGDPYSRRIAVLVMVGGVTLTLGDYLFKSVIAEEVAPEQLATVLSRIYLGLNVCSIVMLAAGVTPLVRRLGVDRSLAVLPVLVVVAAGAVLAGGALVATIFLKAADGTLRYSLHRTATELLYLPMKSGLRSAVKAAIDIVAQAGAKSLASLLILMLVMTPEPRFGVAGAVVISGAVWIALALRLRHAYLDVFRATLSEGVIETEIDHPELDLASIESLIVALGDPDERRVLAAMRILIERGRAALIPNLILYHPSRRVVIHALDTFALTGREHLSDILDRLLDHEDPNVRAASVRASWALQHDVERLRDLVESDCAAVRVSAVAGLAAEELVDAGAYAKAFEEAVRDESEDARLAAATAARLHPHPVTRRALLELATDEDEAVAREAVRAIRASEDAWFTGPLVGILGDRRVRDEVRSALLQRGPAALAVLAEHLTDPETPISVVRHIPRTISRFGTSDAAQVLVESLSRVERGMVRYKLLRGLETMLLGRGRGGEVDVALYRSLDLGGLREEFARTLARSTERLRIERLMATDQRRDPMRATCGGKLLVELLQDKRTLAVERLFMLLGLMDPREDYRAMEEGLGSARAAERASAEELLASLLPRERSRALLALVRGDAGVLEQEAAESGREPLDYPSGLAALQRDDSLVLRAVALYHAGELGLPAPVDSGRDRDASKGDTAVADSASLQDRAVSILRGLSERGARGARPVMHALRAR